MDTFGVEIEEHSFFQMHIVFLATGVSEKVGRSCVGGTKYKEMFKMFIRDSKCLTRKQQQDDAQTQDKIWSI